MDALVHKWGTLGGLITSLYLAWTSKDPHKICLILTALWAFLHGQNVGKRENGKPT